MSDTDHDTYKNKIFRAFGRGNDPSEVEHYFAYKVHRCTQSREKAEALATAGKDYRASRRTNPWLGPAETWESRTIRK